MQGMKRNQKPFWYAPFLRKEKVNGQKVPFYGDAVKLMGNISPGKGGAHIEQFGRDIDYDRVILLYGRDCPVTEDSILFIDVEPERNSDGDYIYDYVVKRVAPSLNTTLIAVSRVKVS